MGLRGFLVVLAVLVGKESLISATSVAVLPDDTHSQECLEELGMKNYYGYGTDEMTYNSSCYAKCIFEKEGKLGEDGLIVSSKFPAESLDALAECLNLIKAQDICKRMSLLETCMMRRTDPYWKKYEECEEFVNYDDGPDGITSHCYQRCQMIVDGSLDEDGKVNPASLTVFESNTNNEITHEEAIARCVKIVNDEDVCAHDINMYRCVSYVLYHWSVEVLETECECAEEHNTYPFFGVQNFDTPRSCYDRCVLIKTGELDEHNLKESEFVKKLNMSETKLEEAFSTCKMTMQETDRCTKDLFFYDCVTYIHYAEPAYLKKQKECALETNTPLVDYRQNFAPKDCNTRCMMIKEEQLDSNGLVNRTNLRQFSINDTLINQAVDDCSALNKNNTCLDDTNAYYCASAKVNEMVNKLCDDEVKNREIDEGGYCYSRCLLTHSGQLSEDGEIVIGYFKDLNKDVAIIERAIKICKTKFLHEDECTRIIDHYNCVTTEIWNPGMDDENSIYASNKSN